MQCGNADVTFLFYTAATGSILYRRVYSIRYWKRLKV